jgi:hypothetical protein
MIQGRIVVLGALGIAVAMSAFAWLFHYQAGHRTAAFWGPEAAQLLLDAPQAILWQLGDAQPVTDPATAPPEPNPDSPPGTTIAHREVLQRRDFSQAPGLIHFRHALTQDANFQWDQHRVRPAELGDWSLAIQFTDPRRGQELLILLDAEAQYLGRYRPADDQVDQLPIPRMGPALLAFLRAEAGL